MTRRRRLSTQDSLWLTMDRPNNLMVVDSVFWTAEPLDWDAVRDLMTTRIVDRYPVFRSRAVLDEDGDWWWEESDDFSVDDHIVRVSLDNPDDPASLQNLIAEYRTQLFDRSKPLWSWIWVDRYLEGSAVITRSHHAIADGMRMVEVAAGLFDSSPDGHPVVTPDVTQHATKNSKAKAREPRSDQHTAGETIRHLATEAGHSAAAMAGRTPGALRGVARWARASVVNPVGAGHGFVTEGAFVARETIQLLQASVNSMLSSEPVASVLSATPGDMDAARKLVLGTRNNPTIWTGSPTTDKGVTWAKPIPLSQVKEVAKANGATVNDVLVACLAGSLQHYLRDHGEHTSSVTFMVPVNLKALHEGPSDELGNAFALIFLELPTDETDMAAVLDDVKRRMARVKTGHEAGITYLLQEQIAGLTSGLYRASVDFFANRAAGVLTNVPGPTSPVYLAGSRVAGIVGWAPMTGDQPMSATIYSYDGQVIVGLAADRVLVPGFEQIVQGYRAVFDELAGLRAD